MAAAPPGGQPVEVMARFDLDGRLTPLRLTWRDVEYPLSPGGRRWEDGTGQHFIVMAPGEQVFELIFVPGEMRWYLRLPGQSLA